jgi:hypothetical protein
MKNSKQTKPLRGQNTNMINETKKSTNVRAGNITKDELIATDNDSGVEYNKEEDEKSKTDNL